MKYIIPYRKREYHLPYFLKAMAGKELVFVEQADKEPFNRAKLLNVGAKEIESEFYCFHDVDMIPVEVNYNPSEVAHLAGRVSQFAHRMPYPTYFGGVTIFSKEVFEAVNGYSNEFFGWGSEDDEMYNNVVNCGFNVEFRPGKFRSLGHKAADRSYHAKNILLNLAGRQGSDGLSNCKYKLISKVKHDNYTWIKVNL